MKNFRLWWSASLLSLALAGLAHADATTSPGENSVYVSQLNASIEHSGTPINGTIARGKSKAVLEVDVSVTDLSGINRAVAARVTVNGVSLEPSSGFDAVANCSGGFFCTLGSQWWLDLDAAETAHPGLFRGKALNISASIFSAAATSTADVSLRARMEKK